MFQIKTIYETNVSLRFMSR